MEFLSSIAAINKLFDLGNRVNATLTKDKAPFNLAIAQILGKLADCHEELVENYQNAHEVDKTAYARATIYSAYAVGLLAEIDDKERLPIRVIMSAWESLADSKQTHSQDAIDAFLVSAHRTVGMMRAWADCTQVIGDSFKN